MKVRSYNHTQCSLRKRTRASAIITNNNFLGAESIFFILSSYLVFFIYVSSFSLSALYITIFFVI